MWSLHYNYVSPMYRSLCRFLPGTTLHTILEQNIKIHNSHCCCAHTLHTPLHSHVCTHALIKLHSCAYTCTNQGCTEPGAEPPTYTLATSSPTTHMHTHTINITTAMVFLRPPPVSHQSVITASQLLEQSACHTTAKY